MNVKTASTRLPLPLEQFFTNQQSRYTYGLGLFGG